LKKRFNMAGRKMHEEYYSRVGASDSAAVGVLTHTLELTAHVPALALHVLLAVVHADGCNAVKLKK
jgi:hypothetical protein